MKQKTDGSKVKNHPAGTKTFLFTELDGSTQLWASHPEMMHAAIKKYQVHLRRAIEEAGGILFREVLNSAYAAFSKAGDAVTAAAQAQRKMQHDDWGENRLWVRMALHSGAAVEKEGDYFGSTLIRARRLLDMGNGGQILLSEATSSLVESVLPSLTCLQDLGEYRLYGLTYPERISQLLVDGLLQEFPPPHTTGAFHQNLPLRMSHFIGREKELARIRQLLAGKAKHRLVSLTGMEGIGKTRLALQSAVGLSGQFSDGICFVDLTPITDSSLVPLTVAQTLGLREEKGSTILGVVEDFLRERNMLIVLDHCDLVAQSCARLVEPLLRSCPEIFFLVTCREALSLEGELALKVPPLSIATPGEVRDLQELIRCDAVQLFTDRVCITQPGFTATKDNVSRIGDICFRLDGIALAIELVAAWANQLSLDQIIDLLEHFFQQQSRGIGKSSQREKTLWILLDWVYSLLSEPERAALRWLAVFRGFTLEAAEGVLSFIGEDFRAEHRELDKTNSRMEAVHSGENLLASLVEKSLLIVDGEPGRVRYWMPEIVRIFALERLESKGEFNLVRNAHLEFYLGFVEQAERELLGTEQRAWLDQIIIEQENIRLALEWALDNQPDKGLRMANALWWYWNIRGYWHEGFSWLEAMLYATEGEQTIHHGRALARAGALAWLMDEEVPASRYALEGLALCEILNDRSGLALSRLVQGLVARRGNLEEAHRHLEASVRIFEQLDDRWGMARALSNLGNVAFSSYHWEAAEENFRNSLLLCREIGDARGAATALNSLGLMAKMKGDLVQARARYLESLIESQKIDNKIGICLALQNLGELSLSMGNYEEAVGLLNDSLVLAREIGNQNGMVHILIWLGHACLALENIEQATDFFLQSRRIARERKLIDLAAQSDFGLGEAARARGDLVKARQYHREVLQHRWQAGALSGVAHSLEAFALLLQAEGEPEKAVQCHSVADGLRERRRLTITPVERARLNQATQQLRRKLRTDRFSSAWQAGRETDVEEIIKQLTAE